MYTAISSALRASKLRLKTVTESSAPGIQAEDAGRGRAQRRLRLFGLRQRELDFGEADHGVLVACGDQAERPP